MNEQELAVKNPVSKKGIWGWMFFDWAAQPFFTVMTTFIFGPYVVSRMVADPNMGQNAWAASIAIAGLFIAVLSPVLGSIAEKTGPRKPWIAVFAFLKISALILLWFASPGSSLIWVLGVFIVATVAAEFSILFNDSMMPSIIPEKQIGRISNIAWGLGYAGGMIVLILVLLLMAANPETGLTLLGNAPIFNLDPAHSEGDRASGPLSALWYFIFILPMLLFTPDTGVRSDSLKNAVRTGISELKSTIKEARQRIGLFRFLIARIIYQDGVTALLALGGTFAASMYGWQATELGIFGIILNVVAIPSCLIAARLDAAMGSKRVVTISIFMLMAATIGVISTGVDYTLFGLISFSDAGTNGLFGSSAEKIYILYGLLIGAAFGPVQASSRSYMACSVSPHEASRYFGLYAFAGRATSFLAPASVSAIGFMTGSVRLGMVAIIVFFLVGWLILRTVPTPQENRID